MTSRRAVAVAVAVALVVLVVLCATVPAVRAVVWGATWGNNMAAIEWGTGCSIAGFLARDHIGRKGAAWWAKHHAEHAIAQHREALRQHEEAKKQEGNPP